jgi:hypothetical protein
MACEGCHQAQLESVAYPYRWKQATLQIVGCRAHVAEVMDVLNHHVERVGSVTERTG